MNIGERIKKKRLSLGIEQQKLAELIGLKKNYNESNRKWKM